MPSELDCRDNIEPNKTEPNRSDPIRSERNELRPPVSAAAAALCVYIALSIALPVPRDFSVEPIN